MAYYNVSTPEFNSHVRRLEETDWAHAEVFNQTIEQAVVNTAALQQANFRLGTRAIPPGGWQNKEYTISDGRIKASSIAEVYWSSGAKDAVIDCEIDGCTQDGALVLTCETVPEDDLIIDIIEIRNEVVDNAV